MIGDVVFQLITDNAANFIKSGKELVAVRNCLFWTSCAARCIDLILEDIGKKYIKAAILKIRQESLWLSSTNLQSCLVG